MKINFLFLAFISLVAVVGLESTIFFKIQADKLYYQKTILVKSISALHSEIDELNEKIYKLENPDKEYGEKLEQMKFEDFSIFNAAK